MALPLVQEFGYTREIEDRVLAPLPVELVAVEKIVAGALQCLIAALLVFPIAAIVPATPVHLHINWLVLVTLLPLACLMSSALGLTFGTMFDPRTVPMLFGVIVVPITFLGCIYYPWKALEAIRWLQVLSLANPLVYISEGFRAALTNIPHMSLLAIYPVMVGLHRAADLEGHLRLQEAGDRLGASGGIGAGVDEARGRGPGQLTGGGELPEGGHRVGVGEQAGRSVVGGGPPGRVDDPPAGLERDAVRVGEVDRSA